MDQIIRLWDVIVALCLTVAVVGNIIIAGHVPGAPLWPHWVAGLGLGAAFANAWNEVLRS